MVIRASVTVDMPGKMIKGMSATIEPAVPGATGEYPEKKTVAMHFVINAGSAARLIRFGGFPGACIEVDNHFTISNEIYDAGPYGENRNGKHEYIDENRMQHGVECIRH